MYWKNLLSILLSDWVNLNTKTYKALQNSGVKIQLLIRTIIPWNAGPCMCLHDYHRPDYLSSDRLKLTPFNVKVRQIYVDDIENNEHNSIHEQSNEITNRIKKHFE